MTVPSTLAELTDTLEQYGLKPVLRGERTREIRQVATLEDAGPGDVSFLSNPKYEKMLQTTRATAVVIRPGVAPPMENTIAARENRRGKLRNRKGDRP